MTRENNKSNQISTILMVVLYAGSTGILAGLIIYTFKVLAQIILDFTIETYLYVSNNPIYIIPLMLVLTLMAFGLSLIIKYEPNAGGGAIPRCAGFVRGLLTFKWLRTLISTFVGALIVFGAGLPFGVEGPGVIMGTSISKGVNDIGKANPAYKKYVLTSGASAGFAIATGSIVAGSIFALEEMHKRFSLLLLFVAMSGATFATFTVRFLDYFFAKDTHIFFPVGSLENIPIELTWIAPLIGIGAGLVAVLFNLIIELGGKLSFEKLSKVPLFVKIAINFLIVSIIGLLVIESIGNGHESIIIPMFSRNFGLLTLVILLIIKIFTISISSSSGVTGGLFVPVLVIGALYAGIFNELSVILGLDPKFTSTIILIGMAAFFGTSMQAPITTIVFVIEASLHAETTIFMVFALLSSMLIAELFHMKPLNEIVLKRLMKQADKDKIYHIYNVKATVTNDSFAKGKAVREILWPANCIIQELKQSKSTNKTNVMVHGGDRTFSFKDTVIFQVQSNDINKTLDELSAIVGIQEFDVFQYKKAIKDEESPIAI